MQTQELPIDFERDASAEPEITATLTNARFIQTGNRQIVAGTIIGDTRKRFRDGETVYTSEILEVDGDIVTTRNSVYRIQRRQ